MSNSFINAYFGRGSPRREQNLFVGFSKHWYMLIDGSLRHQERALDPRTAGSKRLLGRMVLLDVDTGYVYGEYHDRERLNDELPGFLARAWSIKPDHLMRGVPLQLNVPQSSFRELTAHLQSVSEVSGMQLGRLPGGFASGVHAVKAMENALLWLCTQGLKIDLYMAQEASAVLSSYASRSAFAWEEAWRREEGLSTELATLFDTMYNPAGAWRAAPFDLVLSGIPKPSG